MAAVDSQALTRSFRPSTNLSKSTRLNVPQFLQKLYEMVNDTSNNDLIRWSDAGDSFLVLDHERFAREVLGRWFKHQNFQSFVRQLNMYGFHKIPSLQQGVLRSDSDTEIWTFEHSHFRRDQPDLLCLISRKKQASQQPAGAIEANNVEEVQTPATPAATAAAGGQVLDLNQIVTGIQAIKRHQQTISADLNELKASNQALWQEVVAARERHSKQQDMINRILKFLGSVFGRQDHDAKNHRGDRVTPSPPLMARGGQRLMIGDVEKPKRQVEVVEVDDEATRSPTTSSKSESEFPTSAHIDTLSVPSPATDRASMLTPATEAPSPSFYVDSNAQTPAPWSQNQNALPTTQTPYPTLDPNQSQMELHRPQPSQPGMYPGGGQIPFPSSLPATTQDVQNAFHTIMNSPTQLQRFMDALNASSSVPPPAPQPQPIPQQSYQPPVQQQQQQQPNNNAVQAYIPPASYPPFDLSQFNPDMASALLPTGDDGSAALAALADNQQQQTARTWKDAQDINQEVDSMNDNIRELIENMGLDPSALSSPSQPDTSSDPTNSDFDFDAFLRTFAPSTVPDAGFIDGDPVASSVAPGDGDMSGITAFMDDVAADPAPRAKAQAQAQAAAVGAARKRRSDAAELDAGLRPIVPNGAPPPKKSKA